jgi:hypothetical protein
LKTKATKILILLFLGIVLSTQAFAAEVFTEKSEYPPGEVAFIDGVTFWGSEMVTLQVTKSDGTPLSGDGSVPWDVPASSLGDFTTTWSVEWEYAGDVLLVSAVGQESGESATTTFLSPPKNLDQLQNGTGSTPPAWSNGNINSSNSCYSEGSSVAYRYFIDELLADSSHFFTVQMEWTKASIHALDYLTDYDATEDSAINLTGGACGTIATSPPDGCSDPTEVFPFPDFLNTANYSGAIPPDFFTTVNPGFVLDGPRNLMAYNVTIDSIGKYAFNGSASDRTMEFVVYFTVDTSGSVGFFWGGHLASGTDDAWGYGNGSASVSGAPYHMRALNFDGGGGAGQDRSIQNGVICLPPNVGIVCDVDTVCDVGGQTYVCRDTASSANTWTWTITNGTIVGSSTADSVVFTVNGGLGEGDYVTLSVESCDSTSGCPGDFCCDSDEIMIPVKDCNDPPQIYCHADTAVFQCGLAEICIGGFSAIDPDNNIDTYYTSLGTYSNDTICFTPPGDGLYNIEFIVTDTYGEADTCYSSVTVSTNNPPVATCAADTTIFVCHLAPITLSGFSCDDPDGNLVSCLTDVGTLAGDQVTFTPVAGANTITLTATDDCEEIDTCQTTVTVIVNSPPVAECPGDDTLFVCDLSDITLGGFSCSDVDNNLASCLATGGTYAGGQVTFTPVVGDNVITLTATDDCGAIDDCQTTITIVLNTPPVATCPGDTSIFVCDLSPITLPGFSCDDVDGNLVSCVATGGTYAAGAITFTPVPGVNTLTLTATDACDSIDVCQTNVTIVLNTPPVATCPGDTSIFVCDLSPITLPGFSCDDDDDNLVSCVATGGDYAEGAVTFTPVPGVNTITLTATDGCDSIDVCQTNVTITLNTPPVATCRNDTTMFVCDLSPITLPGFSCDDVDDNLVSCIATGGTYADGAITFTPVEGVNTLTLTATDACDATDECQTNVTIVLNRPPVATCPGDMTLFVCDLSDIPLDGFSCFDPDDNLVSCVATGGTYAGGQVTLSPVPGDNLITLTATDACGATDVCSTTVTIVLNQMPWLGDLQDDSLFLCETQELCYTIPFGDPDYPEYQSAPTAYLLSGPGVLTGNELCFTPEADVNATYWFVIQVCDSCGTPSNPALPSPPNSCVIDSFKVKVVFNSPPVAECAADSILSEVCEPIEPVTISGFSCSDPDDNLASCETNYGPLVGDQITFTPVEGDNYIILTATDACGEVDECTTLVTVTVNLPPVASCPSDTLRYTLCQLEDICVDGFTCDDPDGNLASCVVVGHTLVDGTVCFTPVEGANELMLIATDDCGAADTCITPIEVILFAPPSIDDVTVSEALCDTATLCAPLPVVTGGAPPFTWTWNGEPVTDPVCVFFPDDGTVSGPLVVTDSCGRSATATLTINAIINTAPWVDVDAPTDLFLCEAGDTICLDLTIVDPDNGLTGTSDIGWVNMSDSTVCFIADTSGHYCDMVVITDSCDLSGADGYCINIVINSPPQCGDIQDITETLCDPQQICVPFSASDPDDNLVGCSVIEGPGTIVNGQWCYTVTEDIAATVTIQCIDECDATCEISFNIDFDLNEGPIATCPGDDYMIMYSLTEICIPGFSCYDPEPNLVTCSVDVNGVPGVLTGNEVCFTPVWGENHIYLYAEDECGEWDACSTTITVMWECPTVRIEKVHDVLQGHFVEVALTFEDAPLEMGGFDFLIAYDATALTFMEATPGQLLEDCGWEHFSYRYGVYGNCGDACPSGLLRIIAMAETNNGPSHPSCYGPPDDDPYEVAIMKFYVTNDRTFECQYVPIYFFWDDCNDNAVSNINGDTLILDSKIYDFEEVLIWDEDDDDQFPEDARIPFVGAPDYCLEGDKVSPIRCLEFIYGGVDIICSDSIDARGDVNVNGVPNEVADAVMLTNYFISGLSAFGDHIEASIAASDVNADGITLSVADIVYLMRVITGDAPPYPKPIPTGDFDVTTLVADDNMTVSYNSSDRAGAVLLIFNFEGSVGNPTAVSGAAGMDIKYGIDGNELRVLVYSLGTEGVASGQHDLLTIPVEGTMTLIGVEAADYFGTVMNVSTRVMPAKFVLSQNRPNPFNPTTTINLSLPAASDWTLVVYNIAGQMIREFSGYDEAGTVDITWDGTDNNGAKVASGIYLYKATAGGFSETRKMVLMK